jgi:hypothetical protein
MTSISNPNTKTYIRQRWVYILHVPRQGTDTFLTHGVEIIRASGVSYGNNLEVVASERKASVELKNICIRLSRLIKRHLYYVPVSTVPGHMAHRS